MKEENIVYTHQKRPYRAVCIQWDGTNTADVQAMLEHTEVCRDGKYIMVRHKEGIDTLEHGHWVVRGENGAVKVYDDPTFQIKYQFSNDPESVWARKREKAEVCPDCKDGRLRSQPGGGVACDRCDYWFCY